MNSAKQQIEAIFYTALNLPDDQQRREFLDRACAGEPKLRREVEAMISEQSATENFFAGLAGDLEITKEDIEAAVSGRLIEECSGVDERAGSRIGRYKLLQKIGEGGWGVVYMAEQETPIRRRVALKIVKLGLDTRSVIARFQTECQALAMMDHPGIARVLDAGSTESGRPFFVMELVGGVKINEFCDENRLSVRERLELFVDVCQAVQHAHHKGIIHRDLKPSNILVAMMDGTPAPKVIDFGIAKAMEGPLTEQTPQLSREHSIGTPAYMSPEQAGFRGLDVDTRSDIYSLGVLLYELLTGRVPFDPKGEGAARNTDEVKRALLEDEPQWPSRMVAVPGADGSGGVAECRRTDGKSLATELHGDLDYIVMKALEKDRDSRYETANSMAADIQHFLNNEPVTARRPNRLYRFQKLVARNKVLFASGAIVAFGLVVGLIVSVWLVALHRQVRRELAKLYQPVVKVPKPKYLFFEGNTAKLSAAVTGLQPIAYQWYLADTAGTLFTRMTNGGQISGATNITLSIAEVDSGNETNYMLVAKGLFSAATSSVMKVTVRKPPAAITLNYGVTNRDGLLMKTGTDWNSPGYWRDGTEDSGLPASELAQLLPGVPFIVPPGSLVRSPYTADYSAFPGNELILKGDGQFKPNTGSEDNSFSILACKHGNSHWSTGRLYFPNLVLDGGQIDNGDNGIVALEGNMRIGPRNAFIYVDVTGNGDRGFRIDSILSGTGSIEVYLYSALKAFQPGFTNNVAVTQPNNPFTGKWKVTQGVLLGGAVNSLGTNDITVSTQGALETTYDLRNPNATLRLDGCLFLHQNDVFGRVIVGGIALPAGKYTAEQLSVAYPANFPSRWTRKYRSTFDTASGSITVLRDGVAD